MIIFLLCISTVSTSRANDLANGYLKDLCCIVCAACYTRCISLRSNYSFGYSELPLNLLRNAIRVTVNLRYSDYRLLVAVVLELLPVLIMHIQYDDTTF
jgi:hypothetical protein